MVAEEIHQKYYPGVSKKDFALIFCTDTVTSNPEKGKLGKYAKWLLGLYMRKRLNIEDLYKAKEYIPIFDKLSKSNKISDRDLNNYRSLPDIYDAIRPYLKREVVSHKDKLNNIKRKEAEKLYEDDVFVVIYPKTRAASCLYGSNTQWCTASKKQNAFSGYNSKGKLYIVINKATGDKYQFHFETHCYCDETDRLLSEYSLDAIEKIKPTDGLRKFFLSRRFLSGKGSYLCDYDNNDCYNYNASYDDNDWSIRISVLNNRYGLVLDSMNHPVQKLVPYVYDNIRKSACPYIYELTQDDVSELVLLIIEKGIVTTTYYNQDEDITKQFTFPFCNNFMFPVTRADFIHFFLYAEQQFKITYSGHQPNLLKTNLSSAFMFLYFCRMSAKESIDVFDFEKKIKERVEQQEGKSDRALLDAIYIEDQEFFIYVDAGMQYGIFELRYSELITKARRFGEIQCQIPPF
jgi:hypothetical protein